MTAAARHSVIVAYPKARKARIALSGPERSRRKRVRDKAGLALYLVTVDRIACEETLRKARNFTDVQLADKKLIEAELSEVLTLWFERWLRLGHP
jgi:hypothetical protein